MPYHLLNFNQHEQINKTFLAKQIQQTKLLHGPSRQMGQGQLFEFQLTETQLFRHFTGGCTLTEKTLDSLKKNLSVILIHLPK